MKHRRAHVGKLTKLTVGDGIDDAGILDDTGVCHHKAGYVGPVLIEIRACGTGNDGAGDIRATAREGLDGSVGGDAIEAGDDGILMLHQLLAHDRVGLFLVEGAVLAEEDDIFGINEVKAEILCQDQTVEIFTAAGGEIATRMVKHCVLDILKSTGNIEIHAEVGDDGIISFGNFIKHFVNVLISTNHLVASIEHIGHLGILGKTLSGSRGDDILSGGICLDDLCDLSEMFCVGKRGAAEFYNFDLHNGFLSECESVKLKIMIHYII